MNLITQITPINTGRWLCEVWQVGGPRIAWAKTPPLCEVTRLGAEKFVDNMAALCKHLLGHCDHWRIYAETEGEGLICPNFVAGDWEGNEIGEARLPRQEEDSDTPF